MSKPLVELAEFYRKQARVWAEEERRWKETREFCHRKVLEIQAIRRKLRCTSSL